MYVFVSLAYCASCKVQLHTTAYIFALCKNSIIQIAVRVKGVWQWCSHTDRGTTLSRLFAGKDYQSIQQESCSWIVSRPIDKETWDLWGCHLGELRGSPPGRGYWGRIIQQQGQYCNLNAYHEPIIVPSSQLACNSILWLVSCDKWCASMYLCPCVHWLAARQYE
jgi:hypothetical protein